MEDWESRGQKMVMAALNKCTKKSFVERGKTNQGNNRRNLFDDDPDDPEYIPHSDSESLSDSEEIQGKRISNILIPSLTEVKELNEVRHEESSLIANEATHPDIESTFTQLQPVRLDLPEVVAPNDNLNNSQAVFDETENTNNAHNEVEYTKKGTIRKRKKYNTPVNERKKQKLDLTAQKHHVKAGCEESCAHKCKNIISQDRRHFINKEFWKIADSMARKSFMMHSVSTVSVKQRTVQGNNTNFRRNQTFQYSLKDENGTSQIVCKTFFLTTLGYEKSNDKVLRTALSSCKNSVVANKDGRGLKEPHNKINEEPIRNHINSFQPTISHYRREHAPNRLYLSSDLSFILMHKDFVSKYGSLCSYEKYRTVAKKMNISIVKLGHEECEDCEEFKMHSNAHSKDNLDAFCEVCKKWTVHKDKADKARNQYLADKEKEEDRDAIIYCADMEKVIMLPRMDMFKSAIFTHRIVVYNESFVPVGKKQKNSNIFAALWHEGLFGRSKDELISAFYQFLLTKRDKKVITIWLDNCSAQNKNWSLYSFFIYIVQSDEIAATEIVIKYFEPGHTFMAADSFHHRVELSMIRSGNKLYDFEDFTSAVKNASPKTEAFKMDLKHFFLWDDYSSQYKLSKTEPRPYLQNMVEVIFTRGANTMKYKNNFSDEEFIEVNFMKSKMTKTNILPGPKRQEKFVGIPAEKKKNILKNLANLIERNRLQFWQNLPEQ